MTDPVPSKALTFEERCALARKAAVGDRWRKRKRHEHFCQILANDGHGNLKLAHWNRRVTHKWYHYLASEYEPMPAEEPSKDKLCEHGLWVSCPYCEIARLQTALRGIQSCSTCEACRGAALRALGGVPSGYIEATNGLGIHGVWCAKCGSAQGDGHLVGCPNSGAAQPPGDG